MNVEGAPEGFPEYQVKAKLLIRMAEFVDWPEGTFPSPEAPFIIAIAGKDPFGSYLENLVTKEKIKDHPILLTHFASDAEPGRCHMLFIAKTEVSRLDRILSRIDGSPVLIVSDTEAMNRKGVHISFHMSEGRMRFQINLGSAKKSRLVITSQLLRLATKILEG
ncbi:MAG: YfiR family protein [Candidatus Ozemobacteraceae bacterium]